MSDHRARYKNAGLDSKELRRRREEDSSQLRKQKREDVLSKRRLQAPIDDIHDDMVDEDSINNEPSDYILEFPEMIVALLQNDNLQLLIDTSQKVRKILSKEPQPPIDEVIGSGVVPRFVELLERDDCTTLQFEVAWILTNICSGSSEQTRAVLNHGAVDKLIRLLKSPDMKVCEQAVWALGNIIGDGAEFRDLVINEGFVPAFLALIRPEFDIGFLRNETWVLVNLCRYKDPPPSIDVIQQLLPALNYLIQSTDLAILVDTSWAVSYITELGPNYSQLIIDCGLLTRITPLLSHNEIKVQTAAIRALGSIVTGDEDQTQAVIDAGPLPQIYRILKETKSRIAKEVLWFISNVAAGTTKQIQAIIDNKLIPLIIYHLDKGDFSQQKEAAWTVYNMCLSATSKQLQTLVQDNAIPPLCNLLSVKDVHVVRNILEALNCILSCCHEENPEIVEIIEQCGGLDKIENLQNDPNQEIYDFAYNIIDQYFTDPEQQ